MFAYILYRSASLVEYNAPQTANIYLQARPNNRLLGITGYLHHEDGCFVQFLEGSMTSLYTIFSVIQSDGRHREVEVMGSGTVERRRFKEWDMAFTNQEVRRFRGSSSIGACGPRIYDASSEQLFDFVTMLGGYEAREISTQGRLTAA